jgi:SAM-dependent methyltransferase
MITAPTLSQSLRLGSSADWSELLRNRGGFQAEFTRLVSACPQVGGRVLDIGCGGALPPALAGLASREGTLDGVDPDPAVESHPLLARRWHSPFETSVVPGAAYDLAYAYNVVEHLAQPRPFFEGVQRVLKPGGVFWALTPNVRHPFAILSRTIERIGLKGMARRKMGRSDSGAMRVNDYPAYYRGNSPRAVLRAIRGLGFSRATFYFHPCLQWDTYFPRCLRWAPRAYDFVIGTRIASCMQIFMMRLDK